MCADLKSRYNVLNTVVTLKTVFKVTSSQQQQQVLLQNVNYYQITRHHIPGDTNSLVNTATSKSSTKHSVQSTGQQRSETPNPKCIILLYQKPLA